MSAFYDDIANRLFPLDRQMPGSDRIASLDRALAALLSRKAQIELLRRALKVHVEVFGGATHRHGRDDCWASTPPPGAWREQTPDCEECYAMGLVLEALRESEP